MADSVIDLTPRVSAIGYDGPPAGVSISWREERAFSRAGTGADSPLSLSHLILSGHLKRVAMQSPTPGERGKKIERI